MRHAPGARAAGRCGARPAVASGARNSRIRSASSPGRADQQPGGQSRCRAAPAPHAPLVTMTMTTATASAAPNASRSRASAPARSPRFQASSGPTAMASTSGTISGTKVALKIGRADRDLVAADQRRGTADRACRGTPSRRGRQQQVVQHQRALAADRREDARRASAPARAGDRASATPPMATTSSTRMKTPRAGSTAKACTEVSTPERTRKVPSRREREGEDRQQDGPALQRVALLDHDRRMQQRRARPARA